MEFLSKPMSGVWKSTKQTFAEIMDFNDTVIGSGKQRQPPVDGEGSCSGGTNRDANGSSNGAPSTYSEKADDMGGVSPETGKSHPKHPISNMSKTSSKRPVSMVSEDLHTCRRKENSSAESERLNFSDNQQTEQNARHSLNTHFGKIWKDLRTLNMPSKSDATANKKSHHGKSKTLNSSSNSEQHESEKSLRTHRTHSHSRSRQGSFSDSQHFRSNSTDRASVMKYKEDKGRPFLRSVSNDAILSDQAVQHDDDEDADDISAEKMKTKILSLWNNVRYGWTVKTRTSFSLVKPIWVLGKYFQHEVEEQLPGLDTAKSPAVEHFKREFSSRIWLTYRREFPQLAGSSYTTDCGWGCMLRSGQMMLAQALVQHFLGRDWNYYNEQTVEEQRYHHEIVRWFGDQPDDMSPFSLHRLVEIGKSSGKKAGDWYGPASVAHIFKEAMDQAMDLNPLLEQLCVYVAQDCTIYKEDVIKLCRRKRPGSLQPVYSVHGSTSLPFSSPITPPPNTAYSIHQLHAELPAQVVNASAINNSALGCNVNGTTEETDSTPQQIIGPQSGPTDFTTNSKLNQSHTMADQPLQHPTIPTAEADTCTSTQSNITPPKESPIPSHSTLVSTKPKSEYQPHWNGSSPKGKEQPSIPQSGEVGDQSSQVTRTSPTREGEESKGDTSTWCASVILVPVRLGGDEVNPIYISSVQALFKLDFCIGIIGGKPKHSLYYVGYQEEKLIHLDPHYCQPVVDMKTREFSLTSFHCMSPRKMAISKMDPSCTVGFYLRTEDDFHRFCDIVPEIVQSRSGSTNSTDYPMFILRDGSCEDWNGQHSVNTDKPERYLRVRHVNQNGQLIAPMRETEDFVFLDS